MKLIGLQLFLRLTKGQKQIKDSNYMIFHFAAYEKSLNARGTNADPINSHVC